MVRKDLHNNVEEINAFHAAVISTDTTTHGVIIDTQGYSALEFIVQVSSWTDGTYTVLLEEGNESNLGDAATVNAANVFGALPAPASNNAVARVGYRLGIYRYVRLSIVSTVVTTGATVAAVGLLGAPDQMATPST